MSLHRRLPWLPLASGMAKLAVARRESRAAQPQLPPEAGPPPDGVSPSDVPSFGRLGAADRVLAEIDQDGFAFALAAEDVPFFNRRADQLPRRRYRIEVVLREGLVCIRKRFAPGLGASRLRRSFWHKLGLPFYSSIAAGHRLRGVACAGKLRHVDWSERTVYWDFIRGETLREWAACHGSALFDLDLAKDPALRNLSEEEHDRREAEVFSQAGGRQFKERVLDTVEQMNGAGVAVLDVKLGNIVLGWKTGRLYWVDFEYAHFESYPGWAEALEEQHRLLRQLFRE